jgi:hypothetical protein
VLNGERADGKKKDKTEKRERAERHGTPVKEKGSWCHGEGKGNMGGGWGVGGG